MTGPVQAAKTPAVRTAEPERPAAPSRQPVPAAARIRQRPGLDHDVADVHIHPGEASVWSALQTSPGSAQISGPSDPDERAAWENRERARPGPIRWHTGPGAERAARAVRAEAFTVGNQIVLGAAALSGRRAAAIQSHEQAHAALNARAPHGFVTPTRIQRAPGPDVPAQTVPAGPVTSPLTDDAQQQLIQAGIALDPDDEARLAQLYPNGFTLADEPQFVLDLWFGTSVQAFRVPAARVQPLPPLAPASEVWIPKIGKGRSILLSSTVGSRNSVLLDAGSGISRSPTAPKVQQLVSSMGLITSGPARVPDKITGSHSDADHDNALRALLVRPEFSRTAVEVATEQVRAAGAGSWKSMTLTVQPDQRQIEINVVTGAAPGAVIGPAGAQVHRQVTVMDGFTLIEFRSVEAHRDLTDASRSTYNLNRTSPVTVLIDHATAERRVFTADAEGRQFTEIVNAIGDEAFRRLIGAPGSNLRSFEIPHHGGEQSGLDGRGLLNMLRLAYEASGGSVSLLAQTSESFSNKEFSSFRYLDDARIPSLRVTADSAAPGSAEAIRQRGGATETVTLDATGIRSVLAQAAASETVLQGGHRRLAELNELSVRLQAMSTVLAPADTYPALKTSVQTLVTANAQARAETAARLDAVWNALGDAAKGVGGVRAGADMTGVNASLGQLRTFLETDTVNQVRRDLDAHEGAIAAYSRLFVNVSRLLDAYANERVEELRAAKAENTRLVQAARGALGKAVVDEHVRSAWTAARQQLIEDRAERMVREGTQAIAAHKVSLTFRTELATTLGRQLQLNETMELAYQGQLPSTGGIKAGRVAGNLFLLGIEVARLGLELYTSIHNANVAMAAWESGLKVQGTETLAWFARRGIEPRLALMRRSSWGGFDDVTGTLSQDQVRSAVTSATLPAGIPEFTMVVVTGITETDLRRLVLTMSVGGNSAAGWMRENLSHPGAPLFKQFEGEWAIRLWTSGEDTPFFSFDPGNPGYRWVRVDAIAPGLSAELSAQQTERGTAQEALLTLERAAAGTAAIRTVKDSAWVGSRRQVWAYDRGGSPILVDFRERQPCFILESEVASAFGLNWMNGPYGMLRAADSATFRALSETFWARPTGQTSIGGPDGRISREHVSEPNTAGRALVPISELEPYSPPGQSPSR